MCASIKSSRKFKKGKLLLIKESHELNGKYILSISTEVVLITVEKIKL